MEDLIYRQSVTIRGYDVDVIMKAGITALIRILHEAAVDQVVQLGFSALQLEPRGLGWVLSHQYLEIIERPKLGDQVTVVTYPSGIDRAFTYRDYYLYDREEKLLAKAATTWTLLDIHNRKLAEYPEDIRSILLRANTLPHLTRAVQPRLQIGESKATRSFNPGFFELDFNGHVSNHYFFKWMLDPLSFDFLTGHELMDLNVKFRGEAFAGDTITAHIAGEMPDRILHWLMKGKEVIAIGISRWKQNPESRRHRLGQFLQ